MAQSRREFLQLSSAAALGLAAYRLPPQYRIAAPTAPPLTDPTFKELAMRALNAAKSAGAEYSDVRISQNRNQAIQAREHRVQSLTRLRDLRFRRARAREGSVGIRRQPRSLRR